MELATLMRDWAVAMTAHDDAATGGIVLPVRRAAFLDGATMTVEILHVGRWR